MKKQCLSCKEHKDNSDFYSQFKRGKHYIWAVCKTCARNRNKKYQSKSREKHRKRNIEYRKKLRIEVIEMYGGTCVCCGENTNEFLVIDHIKGGGTKQRKQEGFKASSGIYREAKALGYPNDKYRLLCHNCNCSLGFYGYCPHGERG